MKKVKISIIFFIFLVVLCSNIGCKKEEKEKKSLISLSESGIEKAKPPQGCEIVSNPVEFIPVTNNQSYNHETDDSGFTTAYGLADTQKIMLYMADGYLYYYDNEKNKCSLLCNKPDCSHIEEDLWTCNASFPFGDGLACSKGVFYTIDSEKMELIKIIPDTAKRIIVGKLCTVPEDTIERKDGIYALNWMIHRGYIYYYYQMYAGLTEDVYYLNGSNCIYRMSLDKDSEPECILPLVCESNPFYTNIKGDGSYVYINMTQKEKNSGYLYRYNIEAGNVEKLEFLGNDIINYTIKDHVIYYSNASEPEKVYYYDERTKKNQLFFSGDNKKYQYLGCAWSDKDYIYVGYDIKEENDDSSGGMVAFDWQGNMVADIPWTFHKGESLAIDYFCGISDDRLYFLRLKGGEQNPWISVRNTYTMPYYIEKTDLADGTYEIHEAEK